MLSRRTLLVASSATALAACGRSGPPADLFRVALSGLPDSLDPARGEFAAAALVYKQIHAGLTEYGPDGGLAPGLAASWAVSEDGLSWTFRLREGLAWSDGHPLTAEDVAWSARRIVDPAESFAILGDFYAVANARAVHRGELAPSALGVEAPDDRTVIFRLDTPLGLFPILMREFYPFPRHVIDRVGLDWVRPEHIVTAGAYLMREESQLHLLMEKNPRFYDADQVAIPAIRIDAVRDDSTRTRMFRAGDFDLAENPPANQIGFLRERLGERFQSFDAPILRYLKPNHARPELADPAVRKALSDAIDRDFLNASFFNGTASPTHSVLRGTEWPPSRLNPPVRLNRPLEIRTTTGVNEQIAIAIADDWARIGVETELLVSYPTDLYQAVDAGEFDIAIASYNRGLKADPFFMLDPFAPGGFADNFSFSDPDFAALMQSAREESNPATRGAAYRAAEHRLLDLQAVIPLLHDRAHWLVGERLGGTRSDVQPMLWRNLNLEGMSLMTQPALMRDRWLDHARAAGLSEDPALADALVAAYSEPHRHYHTLTHVADLLDKIDAHASDDPALHRMRLAAWFHDAVYDTQASDNEEQSAQWAERALPAIGADNALTTEVAALIRATAQHQSGGADGADNLFLDIDFSILGSEASAYDAYARQIRQEYAWVTEADFQAGRSAFLTQAATAERTFLTDRFETLYGAAARANMQRELDALQAG